MCKLYPHLDDLKNQIKQVPAPLSSKILELLDYSKSYNTKACDQVEDGLKKSRLNQNSSFWIDKKIKGLKDECDEKNLSSILSEIRAFGILFNVFADSLIPGTGSGPDFLTVLGTDRLIIEVYTPQEKSNIAGASSSTNHGYIKVVVKEIFPFGMPNRGNKDTTQGEVVSSIAAIKQKEKQFEDDSINILWVDLMSFKPGGLDILKEQYIPFLSFQSHITFGALWHAFYASKNDKIFDQLETEYQSSHPYVMEFNGRFQTGSKLNFVFFNTEDGIIVFENYRRKCLNSNLYKKIFCIFGFKYENSYLNWPGKNLKRVISEIRKKGIILIKTFDK